jgi:signal transduction histidine kinase
LEGQSISDGEINFRFIFDHMTDLIMVCNSGFVIGDANNAANIVLGKGDNLCGTKCYQSLHQGKHPCLDCPLNDTVSSGTVIPIVRYDDRFNEYFEERCFPVLNQSGELESFILVVKNVTKSRELEEKSAQMKKLAALGKISSGVAHDFNNVLTVVLGRVQLMKKLTTDPYFIKSLDMIEKSALDGASKVRKIQEFSRPGDRAMTGSVNLKSIIEEVLEITRPRWDNAAKARGVLIEPILNLDENLFILGDSSDLRNAFTNIIFNAVDAMSNGGILSIKALKTGNSIRVDFKDTGHGMTEEVIERIFDPFFTTKGVLGSGLGMSEVYGIIKRHNGRIQVESEVGTGTTIKLLFPKSKRLEEEVASGKSGKVKALEIFIVDDEEYIVETLGEYLGEMGHAVHSSNSSVQALSDIKKTHYDVVITDLGMPVINGVELAGLIKKINPMIQVVMISGWALNLKSSELENRVDFVINKPFSFEKINFILAEVEKKIQSLR